MRKTLTRLSLVLFFLSLAHLTMAEEPGILEVGHQLPVDAAPAITYLEDKTGEITLKQASQLPFIRLPKERIDFGFTTSKFWLKLGLSNQSDEEKKLILRTSARFMRPMEIFQSINSDPYTRVLYNDEHSAFGERPANLRHLGVEFTLPPKSTAGFYIRFGAGGQASLNITIAERESILREQYDATLAIMAFISVIGTLVAINLFYFFAVGHKGFLFYGLLESSFILYPAHLEGFTFQYLWPNHPEFNANASPMLGGFCLFFALLFSTTFLRTRHYTPVYYKFMVALLWLLAAFIVLTLFAENRITNQIGLLLNFFITMVVLPHAIYVLYRGHLAARFYLAGWVFIYLSVGYFSASVMGWIDLPFSPLTGIKLGIIAEAIVISMGLADQYRLLNEENNHKQQEIVTQLSARLQEARERVQLEKDKETAMEQIADKSKMLAVASHDIIQPIRSLRFALNSSNKSLHDSNFQQSVGPILEDMEQVVSKVLDDASGVLKAVTTDVRIDIEQLLNEVASNYEREALEKDLFIRLHAQRFRINISALSLKRCISNLVGNAINSTIKGGLLIAARKRGDGLLIQVFDTGKGIPAEKIKDFFAPLEKGVDSDGHGLGLAIVKEICDESGWKYDASSRLGSGSCCSIYLPGVVG